MCQLAAYVGDREATPILLESLRLQEGYMGANATGIATLHEGSIHLIKDNGPVDEVVSKTRISTLHGTIGLGHSRGLLKLDEPKINPAQNAHPFLNEMKTVALMHNGEFDNYKNHWRKLSETHVFTSYVEELDYITDSEVAIHMLTDFMANGVPLKKALIETANTLTGPSLLSVITVDEPEPIYIANRWMPCYLGYSETEAMYASCHIGFDHIHDRFNIFRAPQNSLIQLTSGEIKVTRLNPVQMLPDFELDHEIFEKKVTGLLDEKGELDTFGLLFPLMKKGYDEVYDVDYNEWQRQVKAGWADGNDLVEPLEHLTKQGKIKRHIRQRIEGGVQVPRITWSL
jgi:glucosamine 6-phosphate synthetase-like amidotransferase/phosphosugar isomerase protein